MTEAYAKNNGLVDSNVGIDLLGRDFSTTMNNVIDFLDNNTEVPFNRIKNNQFRDEMYRELNDILGNQDEAITLTQTILETLIEHRGIQEMTTINGIKIKSLNNVNWFSSGISIRQLREQLSSLPDKLKNFISEVIIYDVNNPADLYWEKTYDMRGFESGATGGSGKINIYHGNPINLKGTLLHEAGHNFDSSLGWFSNADSRWKEAMELDSHRFGNQIGCSRYATRAFNSSGTRSEDFAEAIRQYFSMDSSIFHRRYPNRYRILRELLEN